MSIWTKQRVLIAVRTYPVPARSGAEVSCTAGITTDGKWIRLFPLPYRFLEEDQRFRKYQWIDVETTRATNDPRPESHKLKADSIVIGSTISPADGWRERRKLFHHLMGPTFCGLQKQRDEQLWPTLGIIKPRKITRLIIEQTSSTWNNKELAALSQLDLFFTAPKTQLEKLPVIFKYEFVCEDAACPGHACTCTDWELGQSYRKWKRQYGDQWEDAFRLRYETEMRDKFDTHFFVGNLHQYPNAWIVVGLFYPPKPAPVEPDLFG